MEKRKVSHINVSKITHDIEQLLYLQQLGQGLPQDREVIENLSTLKTLIEKSGRKIIEVDDLIESLIGTDYFFSRPSRRAENLLTRALRPSAFAEPTIMRFKEGQYQVLIFDEVLETDALNELQQFFKESMIWFEIKENLNYLFTDARYGMRSNLLTLLQQELLLNLTFFFGQKNVIESWAIKYDLKETGIPTHADQVQGCFTSNLWLTPETSNLDPASGGMTIYNLFPPSDWSWPVAITDKDKIEEFVRQNPCEEFSVPYKANRLILFNSELFHKTNNINFGPRFEDRRVSLTHIYK